MPGVGSCYRTGFVVDGSLSPHDQDDQIDDEKQDDHELEDEQPAVVLIVAEELIEVIEGL